MAGGLVGGGEGDLKMVTQQHGWQKDASDWLHGILFGNSPAAAPAKKEGEKKSDGKDSKAKKKGETDETEAEQIEAQVKETEDNPWTQAGNALVGQLQQAQAPVEAAVSGALVGPAAQTAENVALEATGISPTSSTGQWMSSQMAKGAQEADPLTQALAAYGSAYGAGQVGVDQALSNMGTANSEAIESGPSEPFLNALASRLGQGNWGYELPASVANQLPPSVQEALQTAGWQGITTPKGGWGTGGPSGTSAASALTGLPTTQAAVANANPTAPSSGTSVTG